jgi:hypothetical protein
MRRPGFRGLSLLLAAAAVLTLRPAGAATANVYAWQVRFVDGGSRFAQQISGMGFVSVTATQGISTDVDTGALAQSGPWVPQDYYACISVTTAGREDVGCAIVPASKVSINAAISTATLNFTVPSSLHDGTTLSANVRIDGKSTPTVQFNPWDVQLLPPARGMRYVGPMFSLERWGTVSGRITSEFAGGGELVPYTGPQMRDAVAEMSEGIVHQTSASWS